MEKATEKNVENKEKRVQDENEIIIKNLPFDVC